MRPIETNCVWSYLYTDSIMRTIGQQTWICNSTVIYEIYDLITDASISFKKKKQQALCSHTLHRYTTICRHKKKTHRKMTKHNKSSSFVNVVLNRICHSVLGMVWDTQSIRQETIKLWIYIIVFEHIFCISSDHFYILYLIYWQF